MIGHAFAVLAVFLTQLGQGAFWSMEEAYGINAGFNTNSTGVVLSVSTLLLLAGAVGAGWSVGASDRSLSGEGSRQ